MSKSTVLVLRSVDKDRRAHSNFQWPETGPVEAPDWNPVAECGGGLHGWLRGEGDAGASSCAWEDASFATRLWQVVEVESDAVVTLDGKVKFPRGVVLFTGAQLEATRMIQDAYPGAAVIGGVVVAGEYGTATAGVRGTATAGEYGTATAGYSGTATAGYSGTATAGEYGTATAGKYGTATAGKYGTATAGEYGTATAGVRGTATAGYSGTATAGEYGVIVLSYWDEKTNRRRLVLGYPGEDGIEAGKKYRLDDTRAFVEVVS